MFTPDSLIVNPIVAYLIAAALVGIIAQTWKRRTGVLWGFLTVPAFVFWYSVAINVHRDVYKPGIDEAASAMFGILFSVGTMALVIATLPRRPVVEIDNPQQLAGLGDREKLMEQHRREWVAEMEAKKGLKKCPRCAEFVKLEAVICRFCNFEFPGQASGGSSTTPTGLGPVGPERL